MLTKQEPRELAKYSSDHQGNSFSVTHNYFEGKLRGTDIQQIISRLSVAENALNDLRICVLFGYGSHPQKTYSTLQAKDGVEIIWSGPFLPWWAYPFTLIVASHGGLIAVKERVYLPEVFLRLSTLAMVELYSCQASLLDAIREHVLTHKWRSRIGPLVHRDESHFCFGVDGDTLSSEKFGFETWCSYGKNCPEDLSRTIEGFVEERIGPPS